MNFIEPGGIIEQISAEIEKWHEGPCTLCEENVISIVAIAFENKVPPKRICANCWEHIKRLANREWAAPYAAAFITKPQEKTYEYKGED